jgi:hypothetical protein
MSRVFVSLIVLSLGACCFSRPPPVGVSSASASAPAPSAEVTDSLEDTQSDSVAITRFCRSANADVRRAEDLYSSWVDMDGGPTCHEHDVWRGTGSLSLGPYCVERLSAAARGEPALAAAASAHVVSLRRLDELLADANGYYGRQSYRLDDCAHGRELHPQLIAAFADFDRTDAALDASQTDLEDRAIAARLARLSGDPTRHAELVTETVLDRARRMTRSMEHARIEQSRLVVDDETPIREAVADYTAVVEQLVNEHEVSAPFRAQASVLSEDGRAVVTRLDGSPFDSGELRWLDDGSVFGSPQRVVAHYNALVDSYNEQ